MPPPSFGTLETEKLSYSLAGSGGSLRCLSCSEPAGGGRIAHRSLSPPGLGLCFQHTAPQCTAPAAGVSSRRCFRIPCGALFIGAGLLFHSSVPFGRCNSSPIPLSVLFSFDRSFCYPHHLCLTAIPVSHAVSTTCSLTGRSLSKQETQMFSVLSSSFPLASKSRLRTTTGRARTARLSPSPHVGAANPAPPQPPPGPFPQPAQRPTAADISLSLFAFLEEWVLETCGLQATLKPCHVLSPLVATREDEGRGRLSP